jgi:hypothetical protein
MVTMTDHDYTPDPCPTQFMFDGWYTDRADAVAVLEHVASSGGTAPVGIVQSAAGTWGLVYRARW